MWKKVLIGLLIAVVTAGVVVGVVFGVKACKNGKTHKNDIYSEIKLVEDGETYSSALPLGMVAFSKKTFTTVTYSIDNQTEVTVTGVRSGDAKEHKDYISLYKGMKFIAVSYVNVDISALTAGDHLLKVFVSGTDEEGKAYKFQIGKTINFVKSGTAAVTPQT